MLYINVKSLIKRLLCQPQIIEPLQVKHTHFNDLIDFFLLFLKSFHSESQSMFLQDTLMLSTEDTDGLYVPEVRLQTIIIYGAPQIDTSYVIIQSTRTDKVKRPQKIKWNSKHKVGQMGLYVSRVGLVNLYIQMSCLIL